MAELLSDVTYLNGFKLNDSTVKPSAIGAATPGIAGCVLDTLDYSDVQVVQFTEKNAQRDGVTAAEVYYGVRTIRIGGTLYGLNHGDFFDRLWALRAQFSAPLTWRSSIGDYGYIPLNFSVPTVNLDPVLGWPGGIIYLQINCMPHSFDAPIQRHMLGGKATDPLAIAWQGVLVTRDPAIRAQTPQDQALATTTVVTGATISNASPAVVTKTAHGLTAGTAISFTRLTGATGIVQGTTYYVLAAGLTANTFEVSLTAGGAAINTTSAGTTVSYALVAAVTGSFVNRMTYHAPLNALIVVGGGTNQGAGTITFSGGGSIFTITVPASVNQRIIRIKGTDKIVTSEELSIETNVAPPTFVGSDGWPLISGGTTPWSWTFSGVTILSGSHFWFYEQMA